MESTREILTAGGQIVAAIPSIQYAPVVAKLLRGRWDYTERGTLDRTHVRFFTKETSIELFRSKGYSVLGCYGINSVTSSWSEHPSRFRRLVRSPVGRALGDMDYMHFVIVARRPH